MTPSRVQEILAAVAEKSIGVVGDFCVDAYWELDVNPPELSIETGKPTLAVTKQRYTLGGAGNVAGNVAALGAGRVLAFGGYGDDLYGREMVKLLHDARVETDGMVKTDSEWETPVYAKPYLAKDEQNRIDFGRFNSMSAHFQRTLIDAVQGAIPLLDALIINQQLRHGIYAPDVVEALNRLSREYPSKIFLLDARDRILAFQQMIPKVNAVEAARIFGSSAIRKESVPLSDLRLFGELLYGRFQKPVFITRGSLGIFLFDGNVPSEIPAIAAIPPIDPVGAGDTTSATLACALAAGAPLREAGGLATFAAAVTVQKLKQTGTATPDEILGLIEKLPAGDAERG